MVYHDLLLRQAPADQKSVLSREHGDLSKHIQDQLAPAARFVASLFPVDTSENVMQVSVTRLKRRRVPVLLWAVLVFLSASVPCCAADVLFVEGQSQLSPSKAAAEVASSYYGLRMKTLAVGNDSSNSDVLFALRRHETLAAVISAGALPSLDQETVFAALHRASGGSVPLLVVDVAPGADPALLKKWSKGALTSCGRPVAISSGELWFTSEVKTVTRELSEQVIPITSEKVCGLVFGVSQESQPIAKIRNANIEVSVLMRVTVGTQHIFFAAERAPLDELGSKMRSLPATFAPLASLLMFVRYAAGERAWHSVGHYANLTIDDAWLVDPYGSLVYRGLLSEMLKHNFHTTIAFIPWNFDRSRPDVVSLIRSHPDRFSVCIHGDNHDHVEFGDYQTHPLRIQVSNMRQAIARMERFKEMTGVPYDRVFIFPHEVISPPQTLRAFKEHNFLAAANTINVPMGERAPNTPLFALRDVTLEFADFPVLRRFAVEAPVSQQVRIAIQAFLGQPILLYGHESLFATGIGSFNSVADEVNKIQPETRWLSLGDIVRHLYTERLRDDGQYDVRAFASDIQLDNMHDKDATFFVEKEEDFSFPIKSVTLDGQPVSCVRSPGELSCLVRLTAGGSKHLAVAYENDLNLAEIDVSKRSLRINLLRKLSDFRDLTLSKSSLGRRCVALYYESGMPAKRGLKALFILATLSVFGLIAFLGCRGFVALSLKKRAEAPSAQRASAAPLLAGRLKDCKPGSQGSE